jgi:hypothetical protein
MSNECRHTLTSRVTKTVRHGARVRHRDVDACRGCGHEVTLYREWWTRRQLIPPR